jgi:hypothetical protein
VVLGRGFRRAGKIRRLSFMCKEEHFREIQSLSEKRLIALKQESRWNLLLLWRKVHTGFSTRRATLSCLTIRVGLAVEDDQRSNIQTAKTHGWSFVFKIFVHKVISVMVKRIWFFSRGPDIPALNEFRIFITMFQKHPGDSRAISTHITTLPEMKTKFFFYEEILVTHVNLLIDSNLQSNITCYLT